MSFKTLATGAKQLVVHDAFETILLSLLIESQLTPITNIGISLDGADTATFFAPASICKPALSIVVNIPVHSATTSISNSPQLISDGFLSAVTLIEFPFTTKLFPDTLISSSNFP